MLILIKLDKNYHHSPKNKYKNLIFLQCILRHSNYWHLTYCKLKSLSTSESCTSKPLYPTSSFQVKPPLTNPRHACSSKVLKMCPPVEYYDFKKTQLYTCIVSLIKYFTDYMVHNALNIMTGLLENLIDLAWYSRFVSILLYHIIPL